MLGELPDALARPGYDRARQAVGIVHFGIGAFHRAHQAWYTDAAMNAGDCNWMITGVSLRSADVARQMNPQDGLYALAQQSGGDIETRIVGSVRNVLVASAEPEAVIAALAAPSTHLVSLTITEKGYCRRSGGSLDFDLAHGGSVFHFVAQGLMRRRAAGLPGLTFLSCDNLADNGAKLQAVMLEYLERHASDLAAWFSSECACPSTMVDRIVPATTEADRALVAQFLGGVDDQACVITEPFSQWVIEDRFAGPRPRWEAAGARFVDDVRSYETAKLRMLNGAHSLLAYCGLKAGHSFVHEAIADPQLRALADQLMRNEAAPTIKAAPGQDLAAYAAALIERFANPSLNHRLIQIAMDGSQKIPQRWLGTLAEHARAGGECPAILAGIASWLAHVRGDNVARWGPVDDPLARQLNQAWQKAGSPEVVAAVFGVGGIIASRWQPSEAAIQMIVSALRQP